MTLFETELAQVEDLTVRRSARWPAPAKSRFMPLRAGVLNVWEYDDQQFWFTDGRLLLRGRNEAGKSKVLELLFPFVLDGDISPKKLDPFDTANKSMWWNMIGFHKDRSSAIGYLWLEFGRIDDTNEPEYVTVIVGVQATRAERKVNTWFAVTPQRIDVDLDLNPGDVCRSQDAFVAALHPSARHTTKAGSHRANVASQLFSMSPERFDNLLHLVRQLRKPKLADKLDNKKLSSVLTEALPPLDDSRIEPLANGFAFLDADVEDLRRTEVAYRATATFLEIYRSYARTHVRQRADEVRRAVTSFDDVTRQEREHATTLNRAQQERERLTQDAANLARELAAASGSLAGLDLSGVESLRSLEQIAATDAMIVGNFAAEHGSATGNARIARDDAAAKSAAADEDDAAVTAALGEARRKADAAGVPTTGEATDPVSAAHGLARAVKTRASLVEAVDEADRRASSARLKLGAADQRVESADAVCQSAADKLLHASTSVTQAQSRFADSVDGWRAAAPTIPPDGDGSTVCDQLAQHIADGAERAARDLAAQLAAPSTVAAQETMHAATTTLGDAQGDQRRARQALAAHDALPADPPPPTRSGIPNNRIGTPFWFAVEFNDHVNGTDAAMLEAALDAAGFLDAVITDTGLLDADTDDTVLVADPNPAHGLHDWLHPAEGTDLDLVNRIISSIGAGPETDRVGWVDVEGTWGNGRLTGRWAKATVEHIGGAARAAAHARRRSQLVDALTAADGAVGDAETLLGTATAVAVAVASWLVDFPSVGEWVGAERDVRAANSALADAEAEKRNAVAARDVVLRSVDHELQGLELAVRAAGCAPEQVPSARAALAVAAEATRELAIAASNQARSGPAARAALANAERLARQAASVAQRLEMAVLVAAASKAKFDTAVEIEGADVARVLAEKDRLEKDVNRLRDRQHEVSEASGTARETVGRAESVLRETERRRGQATLERDVALGALAAVVRTGHVALTVMLDSSRDPDDYLQATAGRTLARQIALAVSDSEATAEARNRTIDRLVSEFNTLRNEVGVDFDPHLESAADLLVASATMNGEVIGIAELHAALGEDAEQRRKAIAAEERALIEQHLRDEVGNHLGNCLHNAATQINQMNATLREHPTTSGATVQLRWEVDETAGPAVRTAVHALLTAPATRDEAASAILATFLGDRVGLARRGDIDGADLTERLTNALDYRRWYDFKLSYKTRGGEGELTAKTVGAGSGGQQAKVGHLPLLAAAAGFYLSSPSAPRLCVLDEAFAGIDGPNTADLLAFTVTLDLDMVMTNYDAWFCVPQVPGLAIYHLEKLADSVGVAAIRYQWDGDLQQELDPWLDG